MVKDPAGWLLLMHQLPPHPSHLRVKVWRRLAEIGAVALRNAVYVLPRSEASLEDLQWVRREILDSKGEAVIVEASLVDGLADQDVKQLFRSARDADYDEIVKAARALSKKKLPKADKRREHEDAIAKLEQRLARIAVHDFFGASKREEAVAVVAQLRERLAVGAEPSVASAKTYDVASVQGRTWVTRAGIKVDRIASAWLIRRFIDEGAKLKFTADKSYTPSKNELRYDMFQAEFSHEGDDCTFETLCRRFRLMAPGLRALAEIIHDIDVKDQKFGRAEVAGVAAMIDGLTRTHDDDDMRLERGFVLFDELLAHLASDKSKSR